jgi:3-oxoacyl-[acyl-carrier protein] reductase
MRIDLSGTVALVTGAGGGLGREISLALATNGAAVMVNDVSESGEETCAAIDCLGGKSKFYPFDVGDATAVNEAVAQAKREFGDIDILVNNAGVNTVGNRHPVYEYEDTEWNRIIRIDLDGVFYCSRAVSAGMVGRGTGAIVTVSSVFGIVPARMQCAYTAAKAAIINFTRSIALELGPFGVRANVVAPGSIAVGPTRKLFYSSETKELATSLISHVPLGRPGEASDIANAVLFLVSKHAGYITGSVLTVDGGWTAGFSREW